MNQNLSKLPLSETIKTSWEKVKGSKSTFWGVLGCIILSELLIKGIDKLILHPSNSEVIMSSGVTLIWTVIALTLVILVPILEWGLVYIGLRRGMDLPIQFSMIKHVFDIGILLRILGLTILYIVVFFPLLILLLLPSFYLAMTTLSIVPASTNHAWTLLTFLCYIIGMVLSIHICLRLFLAPAFILLKKANPWKAVKASFKATKSNVWRLFMLCTVNIIFIIVSIIPFGIGLIWSIPYCLITHGIVYKKLVADREDLNMQI